MRCHCQLFTSLDGDAITEFNIDRERWPPTVVVSRPMPCFFFYNRIREKQFFTLPIVNDNEIVRSTSDG